MNSLQNVGGDTDGDPLGGLFHRIAREVRIARGRLDPAMTEKASDDRQPLAERQRPRGEAVTDVVHAHVVERRPGADGLPGPVDVGHVSAGLGARDDPRNARLMR